MSLKHYPSEVMTYYVAGHPNECVNCQEKNDWKKEYEKLDDEREKELKETQEKEGAGAKQMTYQNEVLFDLMESYADVNVFFDRPKEGFRAKGAGLILTSNAVGHFPKKKGDKYSLWFGRGIERWTFKTFKEGVVKISEVIHKTKVEMQFRVEGTEVKKFNRAFAKIESAPKKKKELLKQ